MSKASILIVEDDEAIAAGLSLNLKLEGYTSSLAQDGEEALAAIHKSPPDLILLDIGMPKKDGLELLSELRTAGNRTPVIVLSAREGEYDKVAALRLGADDYVTKPFALAELIARVGAVLRRTGGNGETENKTSHFGDVAVDTGTRTVERGGTPVKLTHLEFELLRFFLDNPKRVLSRRRMLREVWGIQANVSHRTVDNFVGQLRSKLEVDPEHPRYFVTVRGSGYRFDP